HGGLAAQRAQRQRGEQQPDRGGEHDDRGDGGEAAGHGGEQGREGGDEVIGGTDGDAKETGHDRWPSSSGRKRAGDGRGQRERLTGGREVVAAAVTGTRPEAGHGKHGPGAVKRARAGAVRRPPGPPTALL